jgi:hypothetical protein
LHTRIQPGPAGTIARCAVNEHTFFYQRDDQRRGEPSVAGLS